MGDRLPRVLGSPRESEGLGSVEGDRGSDLSVGGGRGTLKGGLLGGLGLDVRGVTGDYRGAKQRGKEGEEERKGVSD
jgi:hypothetical protein